MKGKNFLLLWLMLPLGVMAQTWKNDKEHSRLGFTVTHLMINDITGTFNSFDVIVTSSRPDFSDAVFELNASAKTIDTKLEQRDDDLRGPDFFDVEKYPTMYFKSTSITRIVKNKYKLAGNLTMHGVTKKIVADFIYRGSRIDSSSKKMIAGIQLTAILKRSDFNIGWKLPIENVKNDVLVVADGEFMKD